MRRLAIRLISVLGRYAVVLLILPVALLVWIWSFLLERYSVWPVALAIPVGLIVMAVMVLVLGMLIAGISRRRGVSLSRDDAPDLWDYWDKASPPTRGMRRQIVVDGEINAAMGERSRFAGLLGRDQTLIVGLGLLILLDRPAVEAVLEHEFAHAELKHSHGLTRVGEFLRTYETFENYLEDDLPLVAAALEFGFHGLTAWLQHELLARARQHEFEADRQSATRVGVATEARSSILTEAGARLADQRIFEPLENELLGAIAVPQPPLDRMLARRDELVDPASLRRAADEILAEDPDPNSTHPTLKERLMSIGADLDMEIPPAGPPALQTMLPEATRKRLLDDFNREWTSMTGDRLGID